MERKGLGRIGRLGHRLANYSPQDGIILGRLIPLMWKIGYKNND